MSRCDISLGSKLYSTQRCKTKIILIKTDLKLCPLKSYPSPLQVTLLSGVKQLLHEVTHLPAFCAKFLDKWSWWSYTSPHALMAWTEMAFGFVLNQSFKSDVWLTVHRNSVWIRKNQLDVTFCILYFSSNSCSTNMFRATMCPSSGVDDCVML